MLGYSRWHFIRFVLHADVHTVCHCHVLAFEDAGGVPHEILYDRMKQVVLESLKDGVIFHALFERMAQHYGFRAVPLAPGYKEGKGKVENPFKYVEGNFLAGRTFHDLDDLNRQAQKWLAEIARVRVHRTTREQPAARLTEEQPALIPLPRPSLRGRRGRAAPRRRRLLRGVGHQPLLGAAPLRVEERHGARARREDRDPDRRRDRGRARRALRRSTSATSRPSTRRNFGPRARAGTSSTSQFQRLGAIAEPFAAGLVELHGGSAGYHMGQILKLADKVGVARVAEALRHAARYGAFDHNAVARIVAGKPAKASARLAREQGRLADAARAVPQGDGRASALARRLQEARRQAQRVPVQAHRRQRQEEGGRRRWPVKREID